MANEGNPEQPRTEQLGQVNEAEEKHRFLHDHWPVLAVGAVGAIAVAGIVVGIESSVHRSSSQPKITLPGSNNPNNVSGCNPLEKYIVPVSGASLYGQLYTQEGASQVPYSAEKASDQIMAEACQNSMALAVLQSIYTLYDGQVQTPSDLGVMIEDNYKAIISSDALRKQFENNILNFANIMEFRAEFVISEGASVIEAASNGGFRIARANIPLGTADVYVIGVNGQNLNNIQQERIKNMDNVIGWTNDGRIIINETVAYEFIPKQQQHNQTNAGGTSTNNTLARGSGSGAKGTSGGGKTPEGAPGSNEQTPSTGPTGSTTTTTEVSPTTTTTKAPYVPPTTTIPNNIYKSPMPTNNVTSPGSGATSNPFSPQISSNVYVNTSNILGVKQ